MSALHIEPRAVGALKTNPHNPRTHSARQIRQIADSIRAFGFTNPVLIDDADTLVAGHGRVAAARLLGLESVPTIRLSQMTEAQKRAYVLADNKLALNAGWDAALLALELQYLSELELDFDLDAIGFETAEIDVILAGEASGDADRIPAVDAGPPVSRRGDLWLCGRHRLLCGDAREGSSFSTLLAGARAQMVFTDPPYNVPIAGHVGGRGRIQHREFAMAAGEMTPATFTGFLSTVLGHLSGHSQDGAIHFICMDWRHMDLLLSAAEPHYAELKNLCVWNKSNAGLGSLYRSKHELVFVFKAGTATHINNIELGRCGRNRSNVWDYPGATAFGAERLEALALHPTVKPVALVADAIQDCSKRQGIVLDAFLGSGTTLIAAEETGRCGYGIELDPRYVDVTLRRLAEVAGLEAVHAATGQSLAETAAARAGEVRHGV